MKKLIYGGAVIASFVLLVVVTSCQKENIQPNKTQTTRVDKSFTSDDLVQEKAMGGSACTRKWYETNGGKSFCCKKDPKPNCYDDVYISPSAKLVIDEISHESNSGNEITVIEIIRKNYQLLSEFIPTSDLNLIISKKVSVRTKGDFSTNGKVFIILSKRGVIYHVYPFS